MKRIISGLIAGGMFSMPVKAQTITPDTTTATTVTGTGVFVIGGGSRPDNGPNLFHSFSEFSVPTGGGAIFANPTDVQTIFSRVTGSNLSSIDGLIQTQGSADLFLLNSNGILFGPNASLQVGGSFIGTTATDIMFEDGAVFGITDTTVNPLLSISVPTGLQMGQTPGDITVQSRAFTTASGETLGLVGGDLLIQNATIASSNGHLELGAVGAGSTVSLTRGQTPDEKTWRFGYSAAIAFEDITVDSAAVFVSGNDGGTLQLQGADVAITENGQVYTLMSGAASIEAVTINAHESLTLTGNVAGGPSGVFSIVVPGSSGFGGDINIRTPSLVVQEGAGIQLYSLGGNANIGNLSINADNVEISGMRNGFPSTLTSLTSGTSTGLGGNISINGNVGAKTETLTLANSGRILLYTNSASDSGNLVINANIIEGLGNTDLGVQTAIGVYSFGAGNAGIADITAEQITLTGDAQIFTGTLGAGNGGNLMIRATDLHFDRAGYGGPFSTGLNASVNPGGTGNAGTIDVRTQQLTLLNGAQVSSGTSGAGNGGLIKIQADDITAIGVGADITSVDEFPGGINASIELSATGDAGDIDIKTRRLYLADGAEVATVVTGMGTGGDIIIRDAEEVIATGRSFENNPTAISATVDETGVGTGGSVDITSDRLSVLDGAQVSVSTSGNGDAGTVRIQSNSLIAVDGQESQISGSISTTGVGEGGSVDIRTRQLQVTNSGRISTETDGVGSAGDIRIRADQFSLTDSATITTRSTSSSDGGTVNLRGGSATISGGSSVDATTRSSNGGNLTLALSDVLSLRDLSQLTAEAGGSGNGGNIDITALFVVGSENSDIIANASAGNGGNIDITTQGIFGLQSREQLTPANDITASSEFGINGNVVIDLPSIDPLNGLIVLPTAVLDPSDQIAAGCIADQGANFIATGRGGIPIDPSQGLLEDVSLPAFELSPGGATAHEWLPTTTPTATSLQEGSLPFPSSSPPTAKAVLEASGWGYNAQGEVQLMTIPVASSQSQAQNHAASACLGEHVG